MTKTSYRFKQPFVMGLLLANVVIHATLASIWHDLGAAGNVGISLFACAGMIVMACLMCEVEAVPNG